MQFGWQFEFPWDFAFETLPVTMVDLSLYTKKSVLCTQRDHQQYIIRLEFSQQDYLP